jgi:hypothetical protein
VLTRTAALLLATALTVAGCSSSSDGDQPEAGGTPGATDASGSSTPSTPSTSETPYLPVPAGVELTAPGSQLAVGDHAVVAYKPRQDQVGALDIRVTALEKTTIKDFSAWQLNDAQKQSNPYYVRTLIKNVGDTDLGGREVPLYVVNDQNVLLEPTPFASSFEPCPSTPFPQKFGPGDSVRACLVYLAPDHGDLVSVSFRPEETFNPITWTGDVVKYEPAKPSKPKNSKKPKQQ